jgi:hypothetical protein
MSSDIAYCISLALAFSVKIVGLILGYLTIRLGYQLIVSGVRGEFKFSAKLSGLKADLTNISPGLLFVILGVLLIGYALHFEKGAEFTEKARVGIGGAPLTPPWDLSAEKAGPFSERAPLPPPPPEDTLGLVKKKDKPEEKPEAYDKGAPPPWKLPFK